MVEILYPIAKINLGLRIVRRRPDGFHDIETIFVPMDGLHDELRIEILAQTAPQLKLEVVSREDLGDPRENLVSHAYELLRPYSPPAISLRLTKRIPTGAGLGGGSSDAATLLRWLAHHTAKPLPIPPHEIALSLGSDCPFFLHNAPRFAEGRGEILSPIQLPLHGKFLTLVTPPVHISTRWAYSQAIASGPSHLKQAVEKPLSAWNSLIHNDFQTIVTATHPEVERIIKILNQAGAIYTSLSGSGPTVYAISEAELKLPNLPLCQIHRQKLDLNRGKVARQSNAKSENS